MPPRGQKEVEQPPSPLYIGGKARYEVHCTDQLLSPKSRLRIGTWNVRTRQISTNREKGRREHREDVLWGQADSKQQNSVGRYGGSPMPYEGQRGLSQVELLQFIFGNLRKSSAMFGRFRLIFGTPRNTSGNIRKPSCGFSITAGMVAV